MTTSAVGAAYAAAAPAWVTGPDRVLYDPLARTLVAECPPVIHGARVLDLGAGTGAATRAALSAGAAVVAVDLAATMLAHAVRGAGPRPLAVAADALHLPFADDTFDGTLAAFVLNHLPDPTRALAEAARVTRPRGFVAATTFHKDWDHPAKHIVDAAAARVGFQPPTWYQELKASRAPRAGDPVVLVRSAEAAGLTGVRVIHRSVEIRVHSSHDLVAWRLGMAHLAPFVNDLRPEARRRLADDAAEQLPSGPARICPQILLLTAAAPDR